MLVELIASKLIVIFCGNSHSVLYLCAFVGPAFFALIAFIMLYLFTQ